MRKKSFFGPVLLVPFLACGGSTDHHTITTPDSGSGGSGSGSGSGSCAVSGALGSSYGSAGDVFAFWDGSAAATAAPGSFEEWGGQLNNDTNPDLITLDLFKGYGALMNGIVPGTYAISGDETNNATCGVCLSLIGNAVITSTSVSGDNYLASAGVVTITSVGGSGSGSGSARTYGTLSGTFQNIKFDHVTIDMNSPYTSTVVGDCSATLASGSFTSVIQYGGSAANPPVAPMLRVHWDGNAPVLHNRHL